MEHVKIYFTNFGALELKLGIKQDLHHFLGTISFKLKFKSADFG